MGGSKRVLVFMSGARYVVQPKEWEGPEGKEDPRGDLDALNVYVWFYRCKCGISGQTMRAKAHGFCVKFVRPSI